MQQVGTIPLNKKIVGGWQPCEACGAANARREVELRAGPNARAEERATFRLCESCAGF